MQNSHDDGSTAALRRLYMFLLMWEVMYHVARIFIKVLLEKYPNIVIINNTEKKDDDNNTDSDANSATQGSNDTKSSSSSTVGNNSNNNKNIKQTLLQRGPSYLVSFLHSIITTIRGTMHLYHLWGASNFDKIYIPSKASYNAYDGSTIITYRWAHLHVATTNTLFLSYLLYDLFHILLQYPRLGGVDTILHHVLFAFCSFINGTYGLMAFQFGWLIVGELSTIFLNIRWFLIKTNNNSSNGGGSCNKSSNSNSNSSPLLLLDKVNGMFAATFFITRIGMYTMGIIHLFYYSYTELRSLPVETGVPISLLGLTCGCMLLGWVLNMLWGYKILAMVIDDRRGGGSSKKKKEK